MTMANKLVVNKKLRGEDGYKTFSLRIKAASIDKIDVIAEQTGRSRNELICMFIDFALENCEVES